MHHETLSFGIMLKAQRNCWCFFMAKLIPLSSSLGEKEFLQVAKEKGNLDTFSSNFFYNFFNYFSMNQIFPCLQG
jgi:hypothetical protein